MEFHELCREFISYDTTPAMGNAILAKRAADLCREIGLQVHLFEDSVRDVEQMNLVARAGPGGEDHLVLQTHLDTPDPGPHRAWTKTGANPFNATFYDGRIFGLGAVEAKLDFLCKWQALREMQGCHFKRPVALVGTYGEETGMQGASRLVRRKDLLPQHVLVGGPTDLQLIGAGKGIVIVEVNIPFSIEEIKYRERHDQLESTTTQSKVFRGIQTHSSAPEDGDNAILKMLDYVAALPNSVILMDLDGGISANSVPAYAFVEMDVVGHIEDNIRFKVQVVLDAIRRIQSDFCNYSDSDFVPAQPTLNIGTIRTHAHHLCLTGCFRMPPSVVDAVYKGWMRQLKADLEKAHVSLKIVDYKPPFRLTGESDFIKVCIEGVRTICHREPMSTTSLATEASVFSAGGSKAVLFGPGVGHGNAHSPNESVSLADLDTAKNFYRYVLEKFCL